MNIDRIKEIQKETAYPTSVSVQQALLKVWNECEQEQIRIGTVMSMLPTVDDAGVIAVNVASNVRPKLIAREEAMFIAGFQECVKYLSGQEKGNDR